MARSERETCAPRHAERQGRQGALHALREGRPKKGIPVDDLEEVVVGVEEAITDELNIATVSETKS
jgi:hypothetical protein